MLVWTPAMNIGVPEIDAQHKALFERAGRFHAAVKAHEHNFRLEDLFGYLANYARVHFAAEERFMSDVGYPRLAEHVQEHSEFSGRLLSLVPQWESEDDLTAALAGLLEFLDSWLMDHVTKSDQHVGDFVRSRRN
jgi:hemerythrin-like metal-binding protein